MACKTVIVYFIEGRFTYLQRYCPGPPMECTCTISLEFQGNRNRTVPAVPPGVIGFTEPNLPTMVLNLELKHRRQLGLNLPNDGTDASSTLKDVISVLEQRVVCLPPEKIVDRRAYHSRVCVTVPFKPEVWIQSMNSKFAFV